MIKHVLYAFAVLLSTTSWALNSSHRVYDYSIHSFSDRIYIGGKFTLYNGQARNNLAAVDLNNNLLPWAPSVYHNTNSNLSRVNAVIADTNYIFIGGPFTHVNGSPHAKLAKLDPVTGNTVPWTPNLSNGLNSIVDVNDMVMYKSYLIISDQNQSIHIINKNTGAQIAYTVLPISMNQTYNSKLYLYGDMLYVASSFNQEIYAYSLFQTPTALNVGLAYTIPVYNDVPYTHEYIDLTMQKISALNARLYIQVGQQNTNFPLDNEFKATQTISYTLQVVAPFFSPFVLDSWQANLLDVTTCGSVPCYCNPLPVINQVYANALNKPFFSGLTYHDGNLLMTGYRISKDPASCSFPSNYLSNWFTAKTSAFTQYDSLIRDTIFNAPEGFAKKVTVYSDRVYYITANQDIAGDNLYEEMGAMCLQPAKPASFISFSNPVCRGKTYAYAVPTRPTAAGFQWSYSGTGVTIQGNGNDTVYLKYDINATPGTLSVKTISECGFISKDSLTLNIVFYPKPNANAGADKYFTCVATQVQLNGSSSSSPVTYQWYFSNGDSSTVQNPYLTFNGLQILRVTETTNGCPNYDTMLVGYDTLPPTIVPYAGTTELTCLQSTLLLDAAANYPADSLYWTGSSFSSPNPASVVNPGSYLLSITDTSNGCTGFDTVEVSTNYVIPNVSPPGGTDTLTCTMDSVLLGGSSLSANTVLYWQTPAGDTLVAPAYGNLPGGYTVMAFDTLNGCSASAVFIVQSFTTPPHVGLPQQLTLNCSYDTVALTGYSLTPGATFTWNGSTITNAPNGVLVSDTGYYYFSVTHPLNGCVSTDTFHLIKTNELVIDFGGDTTICHGSAISILAQPIGGTTPITYAWSGGLGSNATISVNPADTTSYAVLVSDGAGCAGYDSVWVNVPNALTDSTATFQPCDPNSPSGQIQVNMSGGVAPYVYSLDTGLTYQISPVFAGLNFGNYQVWVQDAIGCNYTLQASISQASSTASANFLINTTSYEVDTFVVVDISNPRPDSVFWDFPAGCTVLDSNPFAPHVVYTDTGAISITMHAFFGTCELIVTKNVHVFPHDTTLANQHNNNGIKNLTVYPNPNNGQFTYEVEFYKKQDFVVLLFDQQANEVYRFSALKEDFTQQEVSLNASVTGSVILRVISEFDADYKIIVINH